MVSLLRKVATLTGDIRCVLGTTKMMLGVDSYDG